MGVSASAVAKALAEAYVHFKGNANLDANASLKNNMHAHLMNNMKARNDLSNDQKLELANKMINNQDFVNHMANDQDFINQMANDQQFMNNMANNQTFANHMQNKQAFENAMKGHVSLLNDQTFQLDFSGTPLLIQNVCVPGLAFGAIALIYAPGIAAVLLTIIIMLLLAAVGCVVFHFKTAKPQTIQASDEVLKQTREAVEKLTAMHVQQLEDSKQAVSKTELDELVKKYKLDDPSLQLPNRTVPQQQAQKKPQQSVISYYSIGPTPLYESQNPRDGTWTDYSPHDSAKIHAALQNKTNASIDVTKDGKTTTYTVQKSGSQIIQSRDNGNWRPVRKVTRVVQRKSEVPTTLRKEPTAAKNNEVFLKRKVLNGEVVTVLKREDDFVYVRTRDGIDGYMRGGYCLHAPKVQ